MTKQAETGCDVVLALPLIHDEKDPSEGALGCVVARRGYMTTLTLHHLAVFFLVADWKRLEEQSSGSLQIER